MCESHKTVSTCTYIFIAAPLTVKEGKQPKYLSASEYTYKIQCIITHLWMKYSTDTCYNMDETLTQYIKWKKSDTK